MARMYCIVITNNVARFWGWIIIIIIIWNEIFFFQLEKIKLFFLNSKKNFLKENVTQNLCKPPATQRPEET